MTADEIPDAPRPGVSQPLPPEVPSPRSEPEPVDDEPGTEWWRASAAPAEPAPPSDGPSPGRADWALDASRAPAAGPEGEGGRLWNGEQVGEEMRDAWATHGSDGIGAAHEIGAHIGAAIASSLPDPHAAAERRGLDIRWLRLKYNVPAIIISLLVTWRGNTLSGHLGESIATGGIFSLIGMAMGLVLPLLLLAVLPIRTLAVSLLSTVSTWLLRGLSRALGWAWSMPVLGYLLRLILAVAIWSTVFILLRAVGRGLITVLTGV